MKITANDTTTYRIHLDVLNSLFDCDLKAHRRAAKLLPNDALVWFPKLSNGKKLTNDALEWVNVLLDGGKTIKEYWPLHRSQDQLDRDDRKFGNKRRLVFAKYKNGSQDDVYRFLGVYVSVEKFPKEKYTIYKRLSSAIETSDYASSVHTLPAIEPEN